MNLKPVFATASLTAALLVLGSAHAVAPASQKVEMMNAKGEQIGTITLTQKDVKTVKLAIDASGLAPGPHGIHFHENGKCETPDFKSAGSHYGSQGKEHGLKNAKGPHAGDLPNLEVAKDGTVKTEFTTERVSLAADAPNSVKKTGGTSIVIHEKADDQHTSPAGDSGARIACGVIK
ncbi:MAG: superoxide dismutase family protein [Methylotenera sp.]|nr:superoxide dismutase family protein [Oligoflexia bacterium]